MRNYLVIIRHVGIHHKQKIFTVMMSMGCCIHNGKNKTSQPTNTQKITYYVALNVIILDVTIRLKLVNRNLENELAILNELVILQGMSNKPNLWNKKFHVNESEIEGLIPCHRLEIENMSIKEKCLQKPPIVVII